MKKVSRIVWVICYFLIFNYLFISFGVAIIRGIDASAKFGDSIFSQLYAGFIAFWKYGKDLSFWNENLRGWVIAIVVIGPILATTLLLLKHRLEIKNWYINWQLRNYRKKQNSKSNRIKRLENEINQLKKGE